MKKVKLSPMNPILLPGEAVLTELFKLIRVAIEGQPPEVKAELWKMYLDDVKEWRKFWKDAI